MLGRKPLNSKYFRVFQRQTVPWAWHCVILESLRAPWLGFLCMRMPWSHQISMDRLCLDVLRLCWSCSVWHRGNNVSKTQYEEHVRYQKHHKLSNNSQSHYMWRLWQLSIIMDPTASFRDLLPSAFFLLFVFPYFFFSSLNLWKLSRLFMRKSWGYLSQTESFIFMKVFEKAQIHWVLGRPPK